MNDKIKQSVKEKYAEIAEQKASSCCGNSGCCGPQSIEITMIGYEYNGIKGHISEADLGLGCGIPTEYANIKPGETVLDLGSGAGNDAFIAAGLVGDKGSVIGVDMTPQMIDRANNSKKKLNFMNVEFRLGEIESLPVESGSIDVVVSNCVLNLVPDKVKAFWEIFRTLKDGGRFCISDVVISGELPEGFRKSAELYAGCIAGAVSKAEYTGIISGAGFRNIEIKKEKQIELPEEIYHKYLTEAEAAEIQLRNFGVYSITVTAIK